MTAQHSRALEYRRRAQKARRKAEAALDPESQKTLMQIVDTWERMAAYEEKQNATQPDRSREKPTR